MGSCQTKGIEFDDWIQKKAQIQSQFTVMATDEVQILNLSV